MPEHDGPSDARAIARMFDTLARHIDPKPELTFATPFELLVAVVLSAQATDVSVNKATALLFARANTPQQLLDLGLDELIANIRTIGLYNNKAKNLLALCRQLLDRHHGEVPRDRAALEALPGVGRKTANVVLNCAFGEATIAVDTHVHRVAKRLGICQTRTPEQTERVLLRRTPKKHLVEAHHYLLLHGRYTCTARKPHCASCTIRRDCPSVEAG